MSVRRTLSLLPLFACLVGCVTTKVVRKGEEKQKTEDLVQMHGDRLLKPFTTGRTVLCQKLKIEVNAAYHHHLVYPAGGSVTRGDGFVQHDWSQDETIHIRNSRSGGKKVAERRPRTTFRVFVGSTVFIVDQAVTVKKLLKAPPTLTATAAGHVFVTKDGKDAKRYEELQFHDGAVRSR